MCCIICKEWEQGKLTSKEALRNLGELISSTDSGEENDHYWEVSAKIMDKEVPVTESDPELDQKWLEETNETEE